MFSQVFNICLFTFANAHSWVHCTDYKGTGENDFNGAQCAQNAFPRAWFKNADYDANPKYDGFGIDRGFNLDVPVDGSGTRCQGTATIGFDANYGGRQNVVTYRQGQTYRLAWPAKNHAAAVCTNQFIPDTSLDLYVFKQQDENNMRDPSQAEFDRNPMPTSFGADPHVQGQIDFKGFHRCPKFCENTDKAFCHGTFTVPDNLEPGIYTFQWNWEFNRDVDQYTTCWEAFIEATATTSTTTLRPESTTTLRPETTVVIGSTCFNSQCGCPQGGYDATWCTDANAVLLNPYCLESEQNCGDCGGIWCDSDPDAPIDPIIPACTNCCTGGQILAPGTETLVSYPDIDYGNFQSVTCPNGFNGNFQILCNQEGELYSVSLSDGFCQVYCLDDVAQTFYDQGVTDGGDGSTNDALVIVLSVALVLQFLIMLTYVFYKENMLCFKEVIYWDGANEVTGKKVAGFNSTQNRESIQSTL